MAGFHRGRHRTGVEPQRARALFSKRRPHDGGGRRDAADLFERPTADALQGPLLAERISVDGIRVRRLTRRIAVPDDRRGRRARRIADQRRVELVGGIEAARARENEVVGTRSRGHGVHAC